MTRRLGTIVALLFLVSMFTVVMPVVAQPKQGEKSLATRELDVEGVVAEVIESHRKDGVLTVRVRFRNNGKELVKLKDDAGNQTATPRDGGGWLEPTIKPKASWSWWGKFPAPSSDLNNYSLFFKVGPPIDNVPIVNQP